MVISVPLTKVPLLLLLSRISRPAGLDTSTACTREASASSTTTLLVLARPTVAEPREPPADRRGAPPTSLTGREGPVGSDAAAVLSDEPAAGLLASRRRGHRPEHGRLRAGGHRLHRVWFKRLGIAGSR